MDSQFPLQNWMNDDEREAKTKPREGLAQCCILPPEGFFHALCHHLLHEAGTRKAEKENRTKVQYLLAFLVRLGGGAAAASGCFVGSGDARDGFLPSLFPLFSESFNAY